MTLDKAIYQKLKMLRIKSELSIDVVSIKTSIKTSRLYKIEVGSATPTIQELVLLANVYKTSASKLLKSIGY